MDRILSLILLVVMYLLHGLVSLLYVFRKKRPETLEDADWVRNATERELTVARLTGKYPPHPVNRKVGQWPSDDQIRRLAQTMIEKAKRERDTKK